jgi:hypothetical protein
MVPDAVYCQNPLRYKTSRGKVVLFVVYRFCYIDQLEPFHLRLHLVQKKGRRDHRTALSNIVLLLLLV